MEIAIGSDHCGLELKKALVEHLASLGHTCQDFGTHTPDPVDYPDIALAVALEITLGRYTHGILVCGTGIGMAIVANKIPGVRAAQVCDPYSAERARKSNDAQIITLGAQVTGFELAKKLVEAWLGSEYYGGHSASKVEKIKAIDARFRRQATPGDRS